MNAERIERTLQILVATMAVMGTYLLSSGQQLTVLPPLMLGVAISSVYLTDIKKRFVMGPALSSVVAISAAVVAAWQMMARMGPSPFVAMANLLSYLEVVLLYQRKTARVYWQLVMLSLLQVVVSTALSAELADGMMIFIFMFMFILAMMLLMIVNQARECQGRRESTSWWSEAGIVPQMPQRDPSAGTFTGQRTAGPLWDAFGCRLLRRAATATFASLLVAGVVFFLIPRKSGGTKLVDSLMGLERLIGFSQSVELGRPGQLRPSEERVMHVMLFDDRTNEHYTVYDTPLFRGAVLSRYADGGWKRTEAGGDMPSAGAGDEVVRQAITLQALDVDVIPATFPAFPIEPQQGLRFDNLRRQWYRTEQYVGEEYSVTLATTGYRNGQSRRVTPCFSQIDLAKLTELRRRRLPKLIEIAHRELRKFDELNPSEEDSDQNRRREKAKFLEQYFLNPENGFRYSLVSPVRSEKLDPNEDFMTVNRVGHCEYFASALALMLRSQGIPARLVSGFKGDEFNSAGNFWTVRQEHAHVWVEAYLESDQIHEDELAPRERARGGWLRLDPTPGGTSDVTASIGEKTWWSRFRSSVDYMQLLWSIYVDKLDVEVQEEWIYQPIANATQRVTTAIFGENVRGKLKRIAGALDIGEGRWFSVRAAIVSIVFVLCIVGLVYGAIYLWRRLAHRRKSERGPKSATPSAVTAFYRRLEEVLERYGLTRSPGQTQMEMAAEAGQHLGGANAFSPLAELPRVVVDAYYEVRFGERSLNHEEIVRVQRALDELEAGLVLSHEST